MTVLIAGFGACGAGFLFLAGWCWYLKGCNTKIEKALEKRITFLWFQETFLPECKERHSKEDSKVSKQLEKLTKAFESLDDTLRGTLKNKGYLTIINEHEKRIEKLEEK